MPGLSERNNPQHRRLLLLRHAKSAWPDGVPDHQRPLAARGLQAAPAIGSHMAREHLLPDLVLVSDARRTQETWDLVKRRLPGEVESQICKELYEASADQLLDVVGRTPAGAETLLLIGHNPGLQDLALLLAGDGETFVRGALAEKYPTGALAVIDFPFADWADLRPGSGTLSRFENPRSLQ